MCPFHSVNFSTFRTQFHEENPFEYKTDFPVLDPAGEFSRMPHLLTGRVTGRLEPSGKKKKLTPNRVRKQNRRRMYVSGGQKERRALLWTGTEERRFLKLGLPLFNFQNFLVGSGNNFKQLHDELFVLIYTLFYFFTVGTANLGHEYASLFCLILLYHGFTFISNQQNGKIISTSLFIILKPLAGFRKMKR